MEDAEEVEGVTAAEDAGLLKLGGNGLGPGSGSDVNVDGAGVGSAVRRACGDVNRISRKGGDDEHE